MQLMNFDVNPAALEQQFFSHYVDDDFEEYMAKDAFEILKHADDERLLNDMLDELEIFDDDELALLTAPFPRIMR